MQPAIPATTKLPPAVWVNQSSLPSAEPVETLHPTVQSSTHLQKDSLAAFLPPDFRFFIGRKEQLKNLHQLLQNDKVVVIIPEEEILFKIGKSAVTSQYIKGNPSVLWIPARNKKALDAGFSQLGMRFKLELPKVRDYLSKQDRLIVFDGAQDPELLKEYIPQGQCQVIITSRQSEWPFSKIRIGPFSLDEAIDFLCQVTQKKDRAVAKQIAEDLDCLPTSLERAAIVIIKHNADLIGYKGLVNGILDMHSHSLKERSNLGNRNHNFTGREMALVALEETFRTYSKPDSTTKLRLASEVGLGGVGKTQIVLQYAFRNADKYPYLVWRVNCDSEATLQESYRALAEKMEIELDEEEKKQENALIKKVNRRLEKETGWLLIYDNAENQKNLEGLIPQRGGHVLITSRSPDWDIGFAQVFKVGVFKRKESIALIQKMAPLNEADADQLAKLVKDLPIAVAQAAAYIRETRITYAEYARIFKNKSEHLLPAQEPTDEYSKTVNVTWQISMEKIAERENAQRKGSSAPSVASPLMNFCAFLGSSNIPRKELLLPWLKRLHNRGDAVLDNLNRALQLLRDFSMVEMDENSISIHQIVQLVTVNQLNRRLKVKTCGESVQFLAQLFEFDERNITLIKTNQKLLIHVEQLIEHAWKLKAEEQLALDLYGLLANHLKFQGSFTQAYEAWKTCIDKSTSLDPTSTAGYRNNLGLVCRNLGKYDEAKKHYQKALEFCKKAGPKFLPLQVDIKNNLGGLLIYLGNYRDAISECEEALNIKINRLHLDPVSLSIAQTRNNMGLALEGLGEYIRAKEQFEIVLTIKKKVCQLNDITIAGTLINLGLICKNMGMFTKAEEYYLEGIKIFSSFSLNHPSLALFKLNLAVLYRHLKQYEKSEREFNEARKIINASHKDNFSLMAPVKQNLGLLYRDVGEYGKAKRKLLKAVKLFELLYSGNNQLHPKIVPAICDLCLILKDLKEFSEAQEKLNKILEIYKENYSLEHPDVAIMYDILGLTSQDLNEYRKAKEYFEKSLIIRKKCYPSNHYTIAETKHNLGRALHCLGENISAKEQYQEALTIKENAPFLDFLSLANTSNNLGLVLESLREYFGAALMFQKALEIRWKNDPQNHSSILEVNNNLNRVFPICINILHHFAQSMNLSEKSSTEGSGNR